MAKTHEIKLKVFNSRNKDLSFVLEPWGEVHQFGPDDEMVIVATGPVQGYPEVTFDEDSITVYGWTGSTATVYRNGEELSPHKRAPVPQLPSH